MRTALRLRACIPGAPWFLSARENGGLGYAGPLRQLANGPVEEASRGTDLSTRDVWFHRQPRDPPKKATRSREWPKSREVTPSEEHSEVLHAARLVPALVRKRRRPCEKGRITPAQYDLTLTGLNVSPATGERTIAQKSVNLRACSGGCVR